MVVIERIFEILDEIDEILDLLEVKFLEELKGKIVFKNV